MREREVVAPDSTVQVDMSRYSRTVRGVVRKYLLLREV